MLDEDFVHILVLDRDFPHGIPRLHGLVEVIYSLNQLKLHLAGVTNEHRFTSLLIGRSDGHFGGTDFLGCTMAIFQIALAALTSNGIIFYTFEMR